MNLNGIILLAGLLLGAALYLLIALVAAVIALYKPAARPWRIAGIAGLMALGTLCTAAGLFYAWPDGGIEPADTDWIDWLTAPWGLIFALGCWRLTKIR